MTLAQTLRAAIERLKQAGIDNPQLDARWLFCHALKLDRAQLLSQSEQLLTVDEHATLDAIIIRRAAHEPVARIIGAREFWGLPFGLNESTLEPRPDSETLVEAVLKILNATNRRQEKLNLLDLGTGTGCLLLSLLHELPNATGIGIDIAPRAVEQATGNAHALALDHRAAFHVGSWFDGVKKTKAPQSFPPPRGEGLREGGGDANRSPKFDIILSNPPYIPASDIPALMPEVRDYDPLRALDGGSDGLAPYRHMIPQLRNFLKPDGLAIFEVGIGQAQDVAALLRAHAFTHVAVHNDLGGVERCVMAHIS